MSNAKNDVPSGAPGGPRAKLRAWKKGDAPLPQSVLDNLGALERAGKLSPADVVLLRAYEVAQNPPPPDTLDTLLAKLEAYVATAYASRASKRADPVSLLAMMRPSGGLVPGDVVVLAPGDYADKYILSAKVDGIEGKPIVFVGNKDAVVSGVIAVDNPFTVTHGIVPVKGGRVRAGGYAVQVSFDQPG